MDQTPSRRVPAPSVAKRAIPWFLLVVVLVAGLILCLTIGPQIQPFFGTTS